ncbi:DgyrCDS3029 [Dimorphilus gyrociliatus]|uniref:DgyrCDS3029 n=1 Tax=Dimorphilus gyrociliatus TaxID=2664684 RepID=A0A7I8VDR4_9ANNE|nr:DgyrCDS3029 [Dimorphilus gyrociliatus]
MENITTVKYQTAFTAFEALLKSLCLNDFPCGMGNWRENHKSKKKKIEHIDTIESKFSVTLKDYGVKHEKVDNLQELTKIKQSPWKEDYSWSDEAEDLRKFAIHSPWMLNEKFIFEFFKSLKISDKNIREIDAKMLLLTNLEQLTLTANHIQSIESHHLPKKLQVLELYANEISSLADLCSKPPPLLHLGLGRNIINTTDDYITGGFWPNLLSLDMSFNDLSDLHDIIGKLQTLPKLRNLILQGNPISLIPGYRGYTIDCLRKLAYLDDRPITADEKHHFKGLSRRGESVLNEANFDFDVSYIKNIPIPDEVKEPENFPEYPKIIRNYFVQFTFLKQESSGADVLEIMDDDDISTNKPSFRDSEADDEQLTSRQQSSMGHSVLAQSPVIIQSPIQENVEDGTTHVKSSKVPWAPGELMIEWKDTIARDDLLSLRNFLTKEMNVELVEEKILAYPPEMEDEIETGSMRSDSKKKDKNKTKPDKRDHKVYIKARNHHQHIGLIHIILYIIIFCYIYTNKPFCMNVKYFIYIIYIVIVYNY